MSRRIHVNNKILDSSSFRILAKYIYNAGISTISEFHTAVGQFINYRYALEEIDSERLLYLAVPLNTYNDFLNKPFIKSIIQRSQINLIVYDVETEEIIRWQI